ncbi:MAG: hypothetical protein ACJ0UT_08210 [Candidatus Latescibacterota bacterium]
MEDCTEAGTPPPEAEQNATEHTPHSATPNPILLTLSWGFFGMGGYLLYWAVSGYYGAVDTKEAKLAFATLLGIAAFQLGVFVRRWATDLRKHLVGQLMRRGHIENCSALSSNMGGSNMI